jgi:acetyl-CoA synthetase
MPTPRAFAIDFTDVPMIDSSGARSFEVLRAQAAPQGRADVHRWAGRPEVRRVLLASMYAASVADPEAFWAEQGKRMDWIKDYTKVKNTDLTIGSVSIKWFEDGVLNASANCIDRHLVSRGNQTAIIFEPDEPNATPAQHITYASLSEKVNRMANVLLKAQGVMRGDRVVIYMPMIPEAAYAMLACARIGAIHSIVFRRLLARCAGNRINDSGAKVVITADAAPRGGKRTALKSNTDAALLHCSDKVRCLVVKHTGDQTTWIEGRDVDVLA